MELTTEQQNEIRENLSLLLSNFTEKHKILMPEDMSFSIEYDFETILNNIEDFIILCNKLAVEELN